MKEHLAHQMAVQYAGLLKERLLNLPSESRQPDDKTSIKHLTWMCDQVISHNAKGWSVTKAHRWIGYIQGVMTVRGYTTVDTERDEYRELKAKMLQEMEQEA